MAVFADGNQRRGQEPGQERGLERGQARLEAQGRKRGRRRSGHAAPPRWSGRNTYSNFVALMKVTLPVIAVMLVGVTVFWNKLVPNPRLLGTDVASISPDIAKNLAMVNPRFDGVDAEGRPYSLTAREAQQSDGASNEVDLVVPTGDITLQDGTWLTLSSAKGRYYREEEQLDLIGNVSFFQDEGFELRTPTARIDFQTGMASGNEGVEGQGPSGQLTAEGFEFRDRGMVIIFTGQSYLEIYPQDGQGGSGAQSEDAPETRAETKAQEGKIRGINDFDVEGIDPAVPPPPPAEIK